MYRKPGALAICCNNPSLLLPLQHQGNDSQILHLVAERGGCMSAEAHLHGLLELCS